MGGTAPARSTRPCDHRPEPVTAEVLKHALCEAPRESEQLCSKWIKTSYEVHLKYWNNLVVHEQEGKPDLLLLVDPSPYRATQ